MDDLNPDPTRSSYQAEIEGSVDIGGLPNSARTTLMRVARDDSGRLVFVHEEPVTFQLRHRILELPSGHLRRWNRIEIKLRRTVRSKDQWLALTEHPWSARWAQFARFRCAVRDRARRDDALQRAMASSDLHELIRAVEAIAFEPWETDANYRTAAISEPTILERPYRTRQQRPNAPESSIGTWSDGQGPRWVFGLCEEDPAKLEQDVLNSSLLAEAVSVTRPRAVLQIGPKENAFARIHAEAADARYELATIAARQALCGPPDTPTLRADDWTGSEVAALARIIYFDHLYNENRRRRSMS